MRTPEVIERLDHYDKRIHYSITRAIELRKLWLTFQETEGRKIVAVHAAGGAMAICERAIVVETVIILVRLLDERGRRPIFETNRISFPVVAELLALPGIEDELGGRARDWTGGLSPDRQEASVREAIAEFRERLARLKSEVPNREKLLRDFRDENLAHDLHFKEPKERPQHRHVTDMIEELRALSNATSLAIRGNVTAWEYFDEDLERAGRDLYRQLARGIEAEREDRQKRGPKQ